VHRSEILDDTQQMLKRKMIFFLPVLNSNDAIEIIF